MTDAGIDIVLNIYDLHDSNSYLYCMGTGFYHTGVQIENYEYCFSSQGVVRTRPQDAGLGSFRRSVYMGRFSGTLRVIKEVISQMRAAEFKAGTYNVIRHNCNHFSDVLVVTLLDIHIPSWINRLAEIGAQLQATPATIENGDTFGIRAPGSVLQPKVEDVDAASTRTTSSATSSDSPQPKSSFSFFNLLCWTGDAPAGNSRTTEDEEQFQTSTLGRSGVITTPSPQRPELTTKQKELLNKLKRGY